MSKLNNVIKNGVTGSRENILTILVWILAFFMLVHGLTASAPWADEWVEYIVSNLPIRGGAMQEMILTTFQPPLYNWLMHFWLKISDSIFWFRFFNVIPAMTGVICLQRTVRKLCGWIPSLVTTVLLSLSFTWIYMNQESAEYSLMMGLVFLQAWFLVRALEKWSLPMVAGCILSGSAAIWSQYGAVFAVVPMFVVLLLDLLLKKEMKKLAITIVLYGLALVLFALPLWFFFARYQVAANEISQHITAPQLSIWGYLSSFGLLIDYFLLYPMRFEAFFIILGLVILGLAIWFLVRNGRERSPLWYLVLVLLAGYSLLYLLVELHVYAMIHAGESRGLFFRYSDCLLPVYWIVIPAILSVSLKMLPKRLETGSAVLVMAVCITVAFFSAGDIFRGWSKSHEDEYMEILEGENGEVSVLFLGRAWENFQYYLERSDAVIDRLESVNQVLEEKPEEFFVIRSVWGGEEELEELEEKVEGIYVPRQEVSYERDGILDYGSDLVRYVLVS